MEKRIEFRRQQGSASETQFWPRVLAFSIDSLIIRLVIIPILISGLSLFKISISGGSSGASHENEMLSVGSLVLLAFNLIVYVLYFSLTESSLLQATIGKWFLRYKVCDAGFNKISLTKALFRSLLKVISILSVIGVGIIDMTPKRQGFHDLIAKTVLIRR